MSDNYLVELFLGIPNVVLIFGSWSKCIIVQIQIVARSRQNLATRHHRHWTQEMVFKVAAKNRENQSLEA